MSFKAVAAISAGQSAPLTRRLTIKARGKLPTQTDVARSSLLIDDQHDTDASIVSARGFERKPYTIEELTLVKKYLRAAVHGHSPVWRRAGWRPSHSIRRAVPDRPELYLSKRLLTEDPTSRRPGDPPFKSLFKRKNQKPVIFEQPGSLRLISTSLRLPSRPYVTVAAAAVPFNEVATGNLHLEDLLSDEAEEYETQTPGPADLSADEPLAASIPTEPAQALHLGDIVQIPFQTETELAVYLGDDTLQPSIRGRRALVHGHGNTLRSVRYEDFLFRIPGIVPAKLCKRARSVLSLSPAKYTENIRQLDRQNAPTPQIDPRLQAEALDLNVDAEEKGLWEEYGMAYGEPGWKLAYDAKLAIGRYLTNTELQQEQITKEVIDRGIRQLYHRWIEQTGSEKTVYKTTQDAFEALYGDTGAAGHTTKSMPRMLAIHSYMLSDSDHFVADNIEFLASARFRLRGPDELACLQTVREWLRTEHAAISEFMHKCIMPVQGSPVPAAHQKAEWNSNDKTIIQFLQFANDMKREIQINPFTAGAGKLIKMIESAMSVTTSDQISKQVDLLQNKGNLPAAFLLRTKVLEVLRRIGIFRAHENMVLHDRDLGLEQWSAELAEPDRPSLQRQRADDPLDSMRVDFESLPVYVIDDIGASELDDGISFAEAEPSNGKTTSWVHVHIADPTSSLQPNDPQAHLASKRLESVYFPEYTWPMLAFDVIQQNGWSLRDSSGNTDSQPQRAMTFSARIDEDGNVLDEQVQLGSIRNVKAITYDMVNDMLGVSQTCQNLVQAPQCLEWPTVTSPENYDRNSDNRPARTVSQLEDSDKGHLTKLDDISGKLRRKRVQQTAISWINAGSSLSFLSDRSQPPLPTGPETPRLRLTLPSAAHTSAYGKSQAMVAEFMILAGRIAASYLSKRNVAMTYRGQQAPRASSEEELQELLTLRDPNTGNVDYKEVAQRRVVFQPAFNALSPADHWPMGIRAKDGGYVRATSPLRRYSDLLVHWQLKTAVAGTNSRSPFREEEIASVMGRIERVGRARRRLERRSVVFWKIFLLDQKLQEARRDPSKDPVAAELLLGGLSATVLERRASTRALKYDFTIALHQLGLHATATLDAAHRKMPAVGEKVIVDIDGIMLDEYSKVFVSIRNYA